MTTSLFELVVALSLLIVLSLLSISGWQNFGRGDRVLIDVQKIAAAINFARMEAIKRGEPIIFCKSSDHKHCGGEWRDGQLVITARGDILRVLNALPPDAKLSWHSSFGRNDALELLPAGHTSGQQGRFYFSEGQNAGLMPVLVVSQTGRVRMEWVDADGAIQSDSIGK